MRLTSHQTTGGMRRMINPAWFALLCLLAVALPLPAPVVSPADLKAVRNQLDENQDQAKKAGNDLAKFRAEFESSV